MSDFPAYFAQALSQASLDLNSQISNPAITSETDAINQGIFTAIANGVRSVVVGGSTIMTNTIAPPSAVPTERFVGDIEVVGSVTPLPDGYLGKISFTAPHNLVTGQSVTLVGWAPSGWNGTYVATVVDLLNIVIPFVGTPPSNATTNGTISTVLSPTVSSAIVTDAFATITFIGDHGLQTNASVTLSNWTPTSWNGTYTITATTTSEFTFEFPAAPPTSPTAIGNIAVNLPAVQTATLNGPEGDIEFVSPHELVTGDNIVLAGWQPAEWNGTYSVTAYSPTILIIPFITPPATDPTVVGTIAYTLPAVLDTTVTQYQGNINFATAHGLGDGDIIALAGWSPAEWNGDYTVNYISSTEIMIQFTYPTQPATNATVIGTVELYTDPARYGSVGGRTATVSGTIGTLTFTDVHGLTTGDKVILSNWQTAGWDGTYTITVTSPNQFTIDFTEQSKSYYNVWQETESDTAKTTLMNTVIKNFTNAGYTINRIVNLNTNNTFFWQVSW